MPFRVFVLYKSLLKARSKQETIGAFGYGFG
jgi:hypothetical protein